MAKWTGTAKVATGWFRSAKYFLQFKHEKGDPVYPGAPEHYWLEVNSERLAMLAIDLQSRRSEVEVLEAENKRLREKLLSRGYDTKVEINLELGCAADVLAERMGRAVKNTAIEMIKSHADWIRQPSDVDLRTNADIAKKFAGGALPVAMPIGATAREMPGDSV